MKNGAIVKVNSIQTKLLMILLPLFIVSLGVISISSYYFSTNLLANSVNETALATGTDYANRVQENVEKSLLRLEGIADQPALQGSDLGQIGQVLQKAQKEKEGFDVLIYAAAADGNGVTSFGNFANNADRDYVKQVVATKKAAISQPLVSKATGKLSIMMAVPIQTNGQLTGVLIGTVSLERITNMVEQLKFLDTGSGMITDNSGVVIAQPKRPELIGKLNLLEKKINPELNLPKQELDDQLIQLVKTAQEGQQISGKYAFVDGVERVAVATPIHLAGGQTWVMTVAAPEAEATKEVRYLSLIMLVIALISLIVAGALIVFWAKRFVRPIVQLRDESLLLAEGDLRERKMNIALNDELGELARGFRSMQRNLRDLVAKVSNQSEHLAASSEELTASADQSSQAVNQVASSITNVASGADEQLKASHNASEVLEKMAAQIQHVATTSSQLAGHSQNAANKANEGTDSIEQAVKQMSRIETTVEASAKVVADLGAKSKEIGQIVETITGIAGQTNLLALNAAIEAARAGEQGRGFAVVADEVRKLAEQSKTAAEQIAGLISGIQLETDRAVQSMNDGTQEVKVGTEVVQMAGKAFEEIVSLVTKVSAQVQENSAAVNEIANASDKVVETTQRIDQLNQKAADEAQSVSAATEEQSASMEEIAESSRSLAKLASELQEATQKFQV